MIKIKTVNFYAFTLAEVLIALAIVGIVAAITIPTLVNNSQKTQYIVQLEKMTSVLNNGFKQIMVNTDCSDIACTGIISTSTDPTTIASADTMIDNIQAANVFKIDKVCHISKTGCHDQQVYLLNGGNAFVPKTFYSMIVLSDGSVMGVMPTLYPNCDKNDGNNQYATLCTLLSFIDINGPKPPNTFGRDVFRFVLSKNGAVLPVGVVDENNWKSWTQVGAYGCVSGNGETCFGRIVEQGWQMLY